MIKQKYIHISRRLYNLKNADCKKCKDYGKIVSVFLSIYSYLCMINVFNCYYVLIRNLDSLVKLDKFFMID